jgi:uncharacterized protein (TIGR00290 family)
MRDPVILSWSGGKDSALALHELLGSSAYEVAGLLTTMTADHDRISMHGVRRVLVEQQARAAGLPLLTATIPARASNDQYAESITTALVALRGRGIRTVAFGDIFLEDVRAYREAMLAPLGMRAVFPLWGRDTAELAREFIELGFGAVLACVDSHAIDPGFAGREYDAKLLADLPRSADPCGENGEFHTFVHRGPTFSAPIPITRGVFVTREERFRFCDLLPTAAWPESEG